MKLSSDPDVSIDWSPDLNFESEECELGHVKVLVSGSSVSERPRVRKVDC